MTSIEAIEQNARMLQLSLCVNPKLERRVTVMNVGLADRPQTCVVVSSDIDVSSGEVRCDLDSTNLQGVKTEPGLEVRGSVKVVTLDSVLGSRDYFMAKLDVRKQQG